MIRRSDKSSSIFVTKTTTKLKPVLIKHEYESHLRRTILKLLRHRDTFATYLRKIFLFKVWSYKITCLNCNLYQNKIRSFVDSTEKAQFHQKLQLHQRKAERARMAIKEDYEKSQEPSSITSVISIDLEQVLFIPTLTHSQMFCSRQLSCYNLGIHISDNSSAHMCIWNQATTGRGDNEISSALLKVLQGISFSFKKQLIIWSDIGQKNRMLLFLMNYLVTTGKFASIEQKFLVRVHSYLACNRNFAQIKKCKRVTKTFVPRDIEKTEERHNNPFVVHPLERPDFKGFQKACDSLLNTAKLNIPSFNDLEEWKICKVLKKR